MPNLELANQAFQRNLAFGQMAETDIARWLLSRGNTVLPVYDNEYDTGKGPRLFLPNSQLAAPDLLVFKGKSLYWIEAKRKSVFSWYRKGRRWTTGINTYHYDQYLGVQDQLGYPVWLLFLHEISTPWASDLDHGCPSTCPVGLFGQELKILAASESHRCIERKGSQGPMVYWSHQTLKFMATIEDVRQACTS